MLLLEQCIRFCKRSMSYPLHTVINNVLSKCIMDADNGKNHTAKIFFMKFQAQHNITLSTKFNPEEVLEQIRKTIEAKQINFVQFG